MTEHLLGDGSLSRALYYTWDASYLLKLNVSRDVATLCRSHVSKLQGSMNVL